VGVDLVRDAAAVWMPRPVHAVLKSTEYSRVSALRAGATSLHVQTPGSPAASKISPEGIFDFQKVAADSLLAGAVARGDAGASA
jgi:hypothetical protein